MVMTLSLAPNVQLPMARAGGVAAPSNVAGVPSPLNTTVSSSSTSLIGWSPREERELFTIDELVERFSLDGIVKKAGVFDPTKLEWLNGQHLSLTPALELESMVTDKLVNAGLVTHTELDARRDWYLHLIDMLKERARNLDDFLRQARPYFVPAVEYDDEAVAKHWKNPDEVAARMRALRERFETVSDNAWNPDGLEPVLEK